MGLFDMFKKKSSQEEKPVPRYSTEELLQHAKTFIAARNYGFAEVDLKYAVESGDPESQYLLGSLYCNYHVVLDTIELTNLRAMELLRMAAAQDYLPAILAIAEEYKLGGIVEENAEEAIVWYEKAAELGDVDAMVKLGDIYQAGLGVEPNRELELKWYTKAYEAGRGEVAFELGLWYRYDDQEDPEPVDPRLAYEYLMIAAKLEWEKQSDAQWEIGFMYEEGVYVKKNKEMATYWYMLSGADENGEYPD